jgi:hypothetical protein
VSRIAWKSAAYLYAEDSRLSEGDRQLHAIGSKNLNALLGFAETWEDALWAYFRCLLDQELEREIEDTLGHELNDKMPSSYWKEE